jgi:Mn2+/Fe2+ NRAMP family transporter
MMGFVGLMLLAFAANLLFAKPNPTEWARGLVPTGIGSLDLAVLGLVGTTFAIAAAYFQIYLVRQKGIKREDLPASLIDSRVGVLLMAAITLMIMGTAAAALKGVELEGAADVAMQLEPLFGSWGKALFCLGLFSAAYSSFIINSMIGGFVLSDGLGLGCDPGDKWPRYMTAAVLLIGMGVAMYVIKTGIKPMTAIVMAQAVTVIVAPLLAAVLLWLCNRKDIMGEDRNGLLINTLGGVGFMLLLIMAGNTAVYKVWPKVSAWFG